MFKYDVPPFVKSRAAKQVDAFLAMTQDQREIFLSLLPEWTESLDDLAFAVKELS